LDANTERLVWDASPRGIVSIAYERMRLLDVTGPLDAFSTANEMHGATDHLLVDSVIAVGGAAAFRASSSPAAVEPATGAIMPALEAT
jgi:hypothetical protein